MKVAHLTSAHPRDDMRIFHKECCSLEAAGYEVILVVADGKGRETKKNIKIVDVGRASGRLDRVFFTTRKVFKAALLEDAAIYHIHDPELIPCGIKLKKAGKVVIFDSHEDVPSQLLAKPYLNKTLAKVVSKLFDFYERWACRKFNAIVAATPFIEEKFLKINPLSVSVNNFPILSEFSFVDSTSSVRDGKKICYVGGISVIRGIYEIVSSMEFVKSDVSLLLGGKFSEKDVELKAKSLSGWERVEELGWLDRDLIANTLAHSSAGLVTLHPVVNYLDALPVKMFEYMCAGLPVIASDFPLWREIIESSECGVCVDPLDPNKIAEAIDYIVSNPSIASEMGANGRAAVLSRYNWGVEERKLLSLYSTFQSGL
ncbi:glycosyltransferase family 4 protein [Pseudomonas sp. LARHCG127]|jgi:glycosyltransferase involved in cell wall biosynthesis|uniref:glycosyltransferase family 4 protein n=1 Tax=unclassified Pseudomonas TaxID=196821 RepID=UPI0039855B3A